jgi:hypothetical protein
MLQFDKNAPENTKTNQGLRILLICIFAHISRFTRNQEERYTPLHLS